MRDGRSFGAGARSGARSSSARLGMVGTAALACLLLSCASTQPGARTSPPAAVTTAPAAAPNRPVPLDVAVAVRAPLRARYVSSLLGAERPALDIIVTNRSAQPVDVANLRVHLEAVREHVSFRCAETVGPGLGVREPATLAPGAVFVFERDLDCALPLVGAYAVRIAVSFGTGDWRTSRDVSTSTLTVTALPNAAPREIDGIPGLWVSMGASTMLTGSAGRGHGRTVVAIVNGTPKAAELPTMRLVLRVYRAANPIPCEDEPIILGVPSVLGPAETYYEPIDISCIGLAVPGTYDIAASLVILRRSDIDRQISLGRLRVEVLTEPSVGARPWPWWP
jgi:hypothetical protein